LDESSKPPCHAAVFSSLPKRLLNRSNRFSNLEREELRDKYLILASDTAQVLVGNRIEHVGNLPQGFAGASFLPEDNTDKIVQILETNSKTYGGDAIRLPGASYIRINGQVWIWIPRSLTQPAAERWELTQPIRHLARPSRMMQILQEIPRARPSAGDPAFTISTIGVLGRTFLLPTEHSFSYLTIRSYLESQRELFPASTLSYWMTGVVSRRSAFCVFSNVALGPGDCILRFRIFSFSFLRWEFVYDTCISSGFVLGQCCFFIVKTKRESAIYHGGIILFKFQYCDRSIHYTPSPIHLHHPNLPYPTLPKNATYPKKPLALERMRDSRAWYSND